MENSPASFPRALPSGEAPSLTRNMPSTVRSAEVHESLLFSSNPIREPRRRGQRVPTPDTAAVKSGMESGMQHFCDQAFVSPEAAQAGSQALLEAFNDSGLWLASLAHPSQIVSELRQSCCLLTRVIVTQWTRQGETHKLVKLAEALLEAKPRVETHEAGQILALLASLLGILRPAQSPRWLEASRPLLKDSVDPHLLKEARQWVTVGQLLAPLPLEDRLFWNRRLRDPQEDWDWESPEALDALGRLSSLLPAEHDVLSVFQAAVPRCWWELWRERHPSSGVGLGRKSERTIPGFAWGLISGVAAVLAISGLFYLFSGRGASEGEKDPSFAFHEASPNAPAARGSRLVSTKKKEVPVSPKMQARLTRLQTLNTDFPPLERIHSMIKSATLREAEPLIQGRSTIAAERSKGHHAVLQALLLDPPANPEVRALASKTAVRVLTTQEMYETLQLCLYPESPNLAEARECASLLLALGEGLNTSQIEILTAEASTGTSR